EGRPTRRAEWVPAFLACRQNINGSRFPPGRIPLVRPPGVSRDVEASRWCARGDKLPVWTFEQKAELYGAQESADRTRQPAFNPLCNWLVGVKVRRVASEEVDVGFKRIAEWVEPCRFLHAMPRLENLLRRRPERGREFQVAAAVDERHEEVPEEPFRPHIGVFCGDGLSFAALPQNQLVCVTAGYATVPPHH